jgi:hypothetical protein
VENTALVCLICKNSQYFAGKTTLNFNNKFSPSSSPRSIASICGDPSLRRAPPPWPGVLVDYMLDYLMMDLFWPCPYHWRRARWRRQVYDILGDLSSFSCWTFTLQKTEWNNELVIYAWKSVWKAFHLKACILQLMSSENWMGNIVPVEVTYGEDSHQQERMCPVICTKTLKLTMKFWKI